MLYLIGLGLGDKKDITIKGFEIIKRCKRVYLESYTSILVNDKKELEEFYGREVISADREFVEIGADQILADADHEDIAFLVVGDPLGYHLFLKCLILIMDFLERLLMRTLSCELKRKILTTN